nr:MAG TPA: hypothetical protein [Caudoviricetes sp.]
MLKQARELLQIQYSGIQLLQLLTLLVIMDRLLLLLISLALQQQIILMICGSRLRTTFMQILTSHFTLQYVTAQMVSSLLVLHLMKTKILFLLRL